MTKVLELLEKGFVQFYTTLIYVCGILLNKEDLRTINQQILSVIFKKENILKRGFST